MSMLGAILDITRDVRPRRLKLSTLRTFCFRLLFHAVGGLSTFGCCRRVFLFDTRDVAVWRSNVTVKAEQ